MYFKFVVLVIIPMIACEPHLNRVEGATQVTKVPVKTPTKPLINTPAKTPGKTATAAPVNSRKKTVQYGVQWH
ncbi:unnamed protein product [Caenorhabditis brenneri]